MESHYNEYKINITVSLNLTAIVRAKAEGRAKEFLLEDISDDNLRLFIIKQMKNGYGKCGTVKVKKSMKNKYNSSIDFDLEEQFE